MDYKINIQSNLIYGQILSTIKLVGRAGAGIVLDSVDELVKEIDTENDKDVRASYIRALHGSFEAAHFYRGHGFPILSNCVADWDQFSATDKARVAIAHIRKETKERLALGSLMLNMSMRDHKKPLYL